MMLYNSVVCAIWDFLKLIVVQNIEIQIAILFDVAVPLCYNLMLRLTFPFL